jgi:ankyrin repeat protein
MTASNRRTLSGLLGAIVQNEARAVQLVRATPALALARVDAERLVIEVPHHLYIGDTALHLAAAALRPSAVRALLDAGADVHAVNRRGATALHYACDARPAAGKAWQPSRQRSVIALLVHAGSDIARKDRAGADPLHRAVRARSPEAVRCLIARGADVTGRYGRQGTTLLHLATRSTGASGTRGTRAAQQAIVDLLLDGGADPRVIDATGKLPRL